MYVRLIHAVDDNGNEYVYFTEDFDSKPEDFLRPGYKAYFDKKSMLICLAVFRWTMSSKKYSNIDIPHKKLPHNATFLSSMTLLDFHLFIGYNITRKTQGGNHMPVGKGNTQISVTLPNEIVKLLDEEANQSLRSRSNQAARIIIEYYQKKIENLLKK